jgi:hypothetical protein
MTSENEKPCSEPIGKINVLPNLTIDASDWNWEAAPMGHDRLPERAGKTQMLPTAEIDCANWNWAAEPTKLVLQIPVDAFEKPNRSGEAFQDLIASIDRFDRSRGGDGFELSSQRIEEKAAILELVPIGSNDISERIRGAAAAVNKGPGIMAAVA